MHALSVSQGRHKPTCLLFRISALYFLLWFLKLAEKFPLFVTVSSGSCRFLKRDKKGGRNKNKVNRKWNYDNDYNGDCDYDEPLGPTLDEEAQSYGYSDYNDYCDEYFEGHTGG